MKGNIWQVAVLALALALGATLLNTAFAGAAAQDTANETLTVDYDVNSSVSVDAFRYNESVDLESNGTELTAGQDYVWNSSVGNVTWLNTSATTDGDSAQISYGYADHEESTEASATWLRALATPVGLVLLIVALGALWAFSTEGF